MTEKLCSLAFAATVFLLAAAPVGAQLTFEGVEFQVNAFTAGPQSLGGAADPVSRASDGSFVVGWSDQGRGSALVRRFEDDGTPLGAEIEVSTYTTGDQDRPSVKYAEDGSFVVTWESGGDQDGSGDGVFARRFASDGSALTGEVAVNEFTTSAQGRPSIDGTADGFVVVWQSEGQDGDAAGLFGRRFSSDATPTGAEFSVNEYTTGAQRDARVASAADGSFVVVWTDDGRDGDGLGVFGRRFASDATPVGVEFMVHAFTADQQHQADVDSLPNGNFVVAWTVSVPGNSGVQGRVFDSLGEVLTVPFQVNTFQPGYQTRPQVAVHDSGDFVIAWESEILELGRGAIPFPGALVAQNFDSVGAKVGTEFQVNTYVTGSQRDPRISSDGSGTVSVVWDDFGAGGDGRDGSLSGVFGRVLCDPILNPDCSPCSVFGNEQRLNVKPKMSIKKINDGETGNDGFGLGGEFVLPARVSFSNIDPTVLPVRLLIDAADGTNRVDVSLPAAAFAGGGTAGWKTNSRRSKWIFIDATGSPVNGISKALLLDRGSKTPGGVKISIKGKFGDYPVVPGDEAVVATVVLGDGQAGECMKTDFSGDQCRFSSSQTSLKCKG